MVEQSDLLTHAEVERPVSPPQSFRVFVYLRHGETRNDAGFPPVNNPCLSEKGIAQVRAWRGRWSYIAVSPLASCLQSFNESDLVANFKIVTFKLREIKLETADFFEGEEETPESRTEVDKRVEEFVESMVILMREHEEASFLVIGHLRFFQRLAGWDVDLKHGQYEKVDILRTRWASRVA